MNFHLNSSIIAVNTDDETEIVSTRVKAVRAPMNQLQMKFLGLLRHE